MIGAILGGFTILGVFLTVAAWVNGRSIKKVLTEVIEGMDARAEQRHREVIELLKKGFGDLSIDMMELKTRQGQ